MKRHPDALEEAGRFSDESAQPDRTARIWPIIIIFLLIAFALATMVPPVGP
jgi:hypothetical protein